MSAELQQIAKALLQLDETLKMFHGSSGTNLKSIATMVSKGNEIANKKEDYGYRAAMQVTKDQQDIKKTAEKLQKSIDENNTSIKRNAENIKSLQDDMSALMYENLNAAFENELISELTVIARFMPSLGVVFMGISFKTEQLLTTGVQHIIGSLPDKIPNIYTPLNIDIGGNGVQKSSAAIMAETGNIVISSDADITAGTYVYVSGSYFSYQENE